MIFHHFSPKAITKINPAPKDSFKKMENVDKFLHGCRQLGLAPKFLFTPTDLTQMANTAAVLTCLTALAEVWIEIEREIFLFSTSK